jgi:hypothetical protein
MGYRLSPSITRVPDPRRHFLLMHETVLGVISLALLEGCSASEMLRSVEMVDSKH